jgi:biopolymer transport protein ExbD
MQKRLLIFALTLPLMTMAPVVAFASSLEAPAAEQGEEQITIQIDQQTVSITGAQGQTLEVVSLTGKVVKTIAIDSPAQRIELNIPKGCYILKVGKVVRKVSIR